MDNKIKELKKLLDKSKKIVVFTGAGISHESGIPTYRGFGGALWTKYDPNKYANINYFKQNSSYYWNFFKDVRYPVLKKSKPNLAHKALVKLEKKGKLYCIITQNIDGLHQMAGNSHVIELHGNPRKILCLKCKKQYTMDEVYQLLDVELPPKCVCGGNLKPSTIFFGESLQQIALDEAALASKICDLFIVIGSSLVVYPAAELPLLAKNNMAKLVINNIDPTPMDDIADIVINKSASSVFSKILK